MKITIESTSEIGTCNGVPARIWKGATDAGVPVLAFITRLAVAEAADATEFERDLSEPPTVVLLTYRPGDLRPAPAGRNR